jgi:hypothetical protein
LLLFSLGGSRITWVPLKNTDIKMGKVVHTYSTFYSEDETQRLLEPSSRPVLAT